MIRTTNVDGFAIRPATEADAAVVLCFIRQLADYGNGAHVRDYFFPL